MDAPAHDRNACIAAIFHASDLRDHVDPSVEFPRSGLLAARLGRSRRTDASVPCESCGITACSTRRLLPSTD